jgi:hypothetical protein
MEVAADPGTLLGPIDSVWMVRRSLGARLVDALWQHEGDLELPTGTRLKYVEFQSIFDPCSGYDWAWHFFTILEGPATGRGMVLYTDCFDPPHDLLESAD